MKNIFFGINEKMNSISIPQIKPFGERALRVGLLFIALSCVMGFAPRKLVRTKISNGISVMLPKELAPMTPEDIVQRYPSVRAPLGSYTNPDRLVDFAVNVSATQWPDGNAEFAQKIFKASIMSMFDKVDMISEGFVTLHKKKFFFFEFDSRLNADRKQVATQDALMKYTYIMYLVHPTRTLVFSFNCTKDQKEEWQETAKVIMNSIKVR
jgi:hypothetical protein